MNSSEVLRSVEHVLNNHLSSTNSKMRHAFLGVFPINHIPFQKLKPPFYMIINTDPSHKEGQHWVALFQGNENQRIEYFDSYGLPPPQIILTALQTTLTEIILSRKRIQSFCSSVCGEYSICFLLCRLYGMRFHNFVELFKNSTVDNDNFIINFFSHLTCSEINKDRFLSIGICD